MKNKKFNIRIILFLVILLNIQLIAQSVDQIYEEANTKFQNTFGPRYEMTAFMFIDSSLGISTDMFGRYKIEDAYKTLTHCAVLAGEAAITEGKSAPAGFISIYKDGNFIWSSDTLISDYLIGSPSVLTITDLNNDGKIDIVVAWHEGNDQGIEYLWIVSWDGQKGVFINDMKQRRKGDYESVLKGSSDSFEFVDINGDGINEIISDWYVNDPSDRQKVVYRWNGTTYGKYGSIDLPTGNIIIAHNQLNATIKAKLTKSDLKNNYQYTLTNSPTSIQEIEGFFIESRTDSVQSINSPNRWDFFGIKKSLINWQVPPILKGTILQGKSDSNFAYNAKSLPFIATSFIRGRTNTLLTENTTAEDFYQDVRNNSFITKTVGPTNPPNPFVPMNFLDTLSSYTTQSRTLGWIKDQTTADKYLGYFTSAKTSLQQNIIASTRSTLNQVLQDANIDSTNNITSEAYALIRYNTEYLLAQLPTAPVAGCNVKLVNSTGTKLTGGALQYYDGSWKDAVNNNDGTFFVNTTKTSLSLRMTYEYGTQTKSNVAVGSDTVLFQTVNSQIQLQNSSGGLIDTGTVQYYAGAWRTLGTTTNGIATKDLLPNTYSFRMTYAYASKDKQQDIGANAIVVFQTVNAVVQLKNSLGNLIPAPSGDQGTVQYYSGAWRNFGTTSNGIANKELLPNNYSFRMTYEYASKDKQQDLNTNPTVIFQTVNAAVQLQNSQGVLIPAPLGDQGTVQYYSGAWRSFGITTNGVANKELFPNNYSFRMTYEYASKDKQQDLNTNPTVVFQTVNAVVQLQNSQGSLIDQGTVQYYSGAWRTFGTTSNGIANKELLPNNYSFRMTYEYASKDKQQDLNTNPTVVFQTVNAAVQLQNSQGSLIDQGTVQYYSGAWRTFGTTNNGTTNKELLPNNYSFRMTYEYVSIDKQQDLSANSTVSFSTVLCTIRVRNSQDQLVDNAIASYYSGAWRQIGKTVNGEIAKELLPVNLSFRIKYDTQQLDKQQNLSTNNVVEFGIQ